MIDMIDVRRLEALVALHHTGTVSAAAARLHFGQPTISHHLRRLEVETGSVLLQRVGRGVRLTPDGERLARRGEEILALLARAESELAASTSLRAGQIRLYCGPDVRTVPTYTIDDDGMEVQIVVLALDDLRRPVRTTPEGKPIERGRRAAVEALLAEV